MARTPPPALPCSCSQERLEKLRLELSEQYGRELRDVPILIGNLTDQASTGRGRAGRLPVQVGHHLASYAMHTSAECPPLPPLQSSLDSITAQTRVMLSTAGPFALHGTPVVDAAVRTRTHYVDITGETPWVGKMIAAYHEEAAAHDVRIVPCCGFDSIPFDLGALLVVEHMKQLGKEPARVLNVVMGSKGGVSGGTIARWAATAAGGGLSSQGQGVISVVLLWVTAFQAASLPLSCCAAA